MQLRFPWEDDAQPTPTPSPAFTQDAAPRLRGRRPRSAAAARADPAWLCHHLTVSGPAAMVAAFAAAARGAGVIPWRLDLARIEEDVFNLAAAQPPAQRRLTIAGCRVLARQFRERVAAHHAKAVARVGHSLASPFDLHALLPVPAALLERGPNDPATVAWLSAHWGTQRLRRVEARPGRPGRRLPSGHAALGYGFFTDGETPNAAINALASRWPELRFLLRPMPPG